MRFAWAVAGALVLQVVCSEARAAAHESFCARRADALRAFVCEDEELADHMRSLDKELSNIAARTNATEKADLEYSEEDWFNNLPSLCSSKDLREPSQRTAAKPCLSQHIAEHLQALTQLDLVAATPQFRLSPLELEIVRDHIAPAAATIGWAFASETARKGLMRVVGAVTPTKNAADEFLQAFSGPGPSVGVFENRFALGERCMRHACSSEYGAVVLDMNSGEMILAVHQPETKVTVYEKECASPELKRVAESKLRQPWAGTSPGVISPGANTPFSVVVTPCK